MSTEGVMADTDYLDDGANVDLAYGNVGNDDTRIASGSSGSGGYSDVDDLLRDMLNGRIPAWKAKEILLGNTTLALQNSRIAKNSSISYVQATINQRELLRRGQMPPYRFQFQNYENITSPVQFYSPKWGEDAKTGMVVLPVPPETMEVSGGNAPEEVVSASGITFSHAGPYTPLTFALEGFFPYFADFTNKPDYLPDDTLRRGYYQPHGLCTKFIKAMRAGQPLVFSVVQPTNKQKLMDTHVVVVTDFAWSYRAGHGQDRFWTMTLREWFPQKMIQTGRKPGKGTQGSNKPPRAPVPANSVYIIKPGDTLSGIADRKMGNASRWRELYTLNKDVIEKAARSRGLTSSAGGGPLPMRTIGWWIFPGTELQIPA